MQRAPFCKHTYNESLFLESSALFLLNAGIFSSAPVKIIPEWRTLTNTKTEVWTKHLWKERFSGIQFGRQAGEENVSSSLARHWTRENDEDEEFGAL